MVYVKLKIGPSFCSLNNTWFFSFAVLIAMKRNTYGFV